MRSLSLFSWTNLLPSLLAHQTTLPLLPPPSLGVGGQFSTVSGETHRSITRACFTVVGHEVDPVILGIPRFHISFISKYSIRTEKHTNHLRSLVNFHKRNIYWCPKVTCCPHSLSNMFADFWLYAKGTICHQLSCVYLSWFNTFVSFIHVFAGSNGSFSPSIIYHYKTMSQFGFPWWLSGKESTCQGRRRRRYGYDLRVRKSLWRRAWQPTPVFLPGKSRGQRPGGLQYIGSQKSQIRLSDSTAKYHNLFGWH